MKGTGKATTAVGRSMGNAVLHPSQALRGAGQAVKTATVGGAFGYVGWKKLTTDASVSRIVSEAVVGKPATNVLASTVDDARELKEKAGETVSAIGDAVSGAGSQLNGVSNFMQATSGGRSLGHARRVLQQPWAWQRVGVEHRGAGRRSVPRVRTTRLAGQDCRVVPGNAAHRQQCGCSPHGTAGECVEDTDSCTLSGGADPKRWNEKIEGQNNTEQ